MFRQITKICNYIWFLDTLIIKLVMELQHFSGKNFQTQLSRKELLEISDEINKLYAPVVAADKKTEQNHNYKFSSQDLLEISQNISLYYSPKISTNANKLVILPIDPHHLYAYWELDDNQSHSMSQSMFNNELTLRVYSRIEGNRDLNQSSPLAEIAIDKFYSRQKIRIPLSKKATAYSASIGKMKPENGFMSLLDSNNTYTLHSTAEYREDKNSQVSSLGFNNIIDDNNNPQAIVLDNHAFYESKSSEKSHYPSTNYSAKGKKR